MISPNRLNELKLLFEEDGVHLSDAVALEIGLWLLERARSVAVRIPPDKAHLLENIQAEMASFRTLHNGKKVRHADLKPCTETSKA